MSTAWRHVSTRRWRRFREWILARDHHTCRIRMAGVCIGVATHVDHIIPISIRPDLMFDETNCRAACAPCNRARRATPDHLIRRAASPSRNW